MRVEGKRGKGKTAETKGNRERQQMNNEGGWVRLNCPFRHRQTPSQTVNSNQLYFRDREMFGTRTVV